MPFLPRSLSIGRELFALPSEHIPHSEVPFMKFAQNRLLYLTSLTVEYFYDYHF